MHSIAQNFNKFMKLLAKFSLLTFLSVCFSYEAYNQLVKVLLHSSQVISVLYGILLVHYS